MAGSPGTHPRLLGFQWLLDQANDRIRAWRTWSLGNCGEIVGGKWWETEVYQGVSGSAGCGKRRKETKVGN